MNSRDRILMTLEHEEPDRVPLTDHIYMPRSLEGVLGKPDVRTNTPEEYLQVHRTLGLDLVAAFPVSYPMTADEKGMYVNNWGIRWKVIDEMPWYLEGTLKAPEDLENVVTPDPSDARWYEPTEELIRLVAGDLAIGGVVSGPFTSSWQAMGFRTYVRMLYTNQNAVRRFIEKITSYHIEMGKEFIDRGVDLIWIPDDLGYVHGPMLNPELFRRFIFRPLKRMTDTFKGRGVKVLMHNDGHLMPIMDDLVDVGIDAIHPLERAAGMDLETMKNKYGNRLTLIGNVNSKTVLQHGSYDDIRNQVLECLTIAAPGGGYILASDHSIHEGIPSANAKFMFTVAKKYGEYPITIEK